MKRLVSKFKEQRKGLLELETKLHNKHKMLVKEQEALFEKKPSDLRELEIKLHNKYKMLVKEQKELFDEKISSVASDVVWTIQRRNKTYIKELEVKFKQLLKEESKKLEAQFTRTVERSVCREVKVQLASQNLEAPRYRRRLRDNFQPFHYPHDDTIALRQYTHHHTRQATRDDDTILTSNAFICCCLVILVWFYGWPAFNFLKCF